MLDTLIPNFEQELTKLREVGTSGFVLGFGLSFQGPEHLHSEFPDEWRRIYETRNYFIADPILLWHITNTGRRRWSEVKLPDLREVMEAAKPFGLVYGAVFSRKNGLKRSFMTVARSDRELTDTEIEVLDTKFATWVDLVMDRAALSQGELEVLRGFRDGLGQRDVADALCIAESTVKQRAIKACKKLNAKTRTQAVAVAVARNYFA